MSLTWSISQDQMLHTCERRYYFQYILSARINSRDPLRREIAFLKKLKTVPAWKGALFHSLVADYFKGLIRNTDITPAQLIEPYKAVIRKQWEASEKYPDRDVGERKSKNDDFRLFEHEYKEKLERNQLEMILSQIEFLVTQFSKWLDGASLCDDVKSASKVWIEPTPFGKEAPGLDVDGVQIITKVDLALIADDGRFCIYDWKTGPPLNQPMHILNQAEFQAGLYQLWPHIKFGMSLDSLSANLVYIGDKEFPSYKAYSLDENHREHILALVRRSISKMKHLKGLYGSSRLMMKDLDFAVFDKACLTCPFKRICQRELHYD